MRLARTGVGSCPLPAPLPPRQLHHKHVKRRTLDILAGRAEPGHGSQGDRLCAQVLSGTSTSAAPPNEPGAAQQSPSAAQAEQNGGSGNAAPLNTPPPASSSPSSTAGLPDSSFTIKPIYVFLFCLIFIGGTLFASATLQFTSPSRWRSGS